MLPLPGQRKLCFGETAYKACWAERCHRLLLLVDGVDIESVTVGNDSTQKEKRKFIPRWLKNVRMAPVPLRENTSCIVMFALSKTRMRST